MLTLNILKSNADQGPRNERDGRHYHREHFGGGRRHRSTTVVVNGIRVHKQSADGSSISSSSSSSSSILTTSNQPTVGGAYEIEIPVGAFYKPLLLPEASSQQGFSGTASSTSTSLTTANLGSLEAATGPQFVRPAGNLPTPPDRFGFENPPPPRADALPNCGCVQRGQCLGEVGAYTRQVVQYSDVVCGLQFQTCCFDGPYAGSYVRFPFCSEHFNSLIYFKLIIIPNFV